jgi:hypothetical protein
MSIPKPHKKCKVIDCDNYAFSKEVCCTHCNWTDFSKPDHNKLKKKIQGKISTKVTFNNNDFAYDNESIQLFLLSKVENPIPDGIEAIKTEKSKKWIEICRCRMTSFKV